MKVEEGVRLVLEARRRAEEEHDKQHTRLKVEEEARLVEKKSLKSEEEDLRLKAEDEYRLVEEAMLKSEQEDQENLKA